jgi:Ni/Co efflux regulator RcnB
MKRMLLSVAAAAMVAAPLAAPAYAQPGRGYDYSQNDRGYDRRDDRRDNDRDVRVVVKHKSLWRDTRRDARWDTKVHNGYFIRNEWHYGPPPASAYRSKGFQLGYKPWARGDRLGYYNNRVREVNYRDYRLKQPPRGYHYVRDDNTGEIILAAIATGLIAAIIAN